MQKTNGLLGHNMQLATLCNNQACTISAFGKFPLAFQLKSRDDGRIAVVVLEREREKEGVGLSCCQFFPMGLSDNWKSVSSLFGEWPL